MQGSEEGSFRFPRGAAATVKQVVRDAANELNGRVTIEVTSFYNANSSYRSTQRWLEAIDLWKQEHPLCHESEIVLRSIVDGYTVYGRHVPGKPRAPRAADVELFAPSASLRTTELIYEKFVISFKDEYVIWWTVPNTTELEAVRKHPVAQAFFGALDQVEWTANTGGIVKRGRGTLVDAYGPNGVAEREKVLQGWG